MAPKAKKGSKHADAADELLLDRLVEAIERGSSPAKAEKQGMTKAQAAVAHEKMILEMGNRMVEARRKLPYTDEQLQLAFELQQEQRRREIAAAQYVNVPVPLPQNYKEWHEVNDEIWVRYQQFDGSNETMKRFVDIFTRELTEPYNDFTHQHFVFGWPDLAVAVYAVRSKAAPPAGLHEGHFAGAVVSKVSRKGPGEPLRGYVAMLAVEKEFRGARIGSRLVSITKELMDAKGCDVVYLETPLSNKRALKLYMDLGFAKVKFLPSYYLDGSDAVRLKLWLKPLRRVTDGNASDVGNPPGQERSEPVSS